MTLESERDAILALASDDDQDHWQIGVHYNNIVDHRLAEANGYRRSRDFFAKEIKAIPQSTLSQYGAVARAYKREDVLKYGITKLAALLTYATLISAPRSAPPGSIQVFIPQKDGSARMKLFADCTRAEVLAAIKRLKKPESSRVPPPDLNRISTLQNAINRVPGQRGQVFLKARLRKKRTVVDLENVTLADLAAVISALHDALKSQSAP